MASASVRHRVHRDLHGLSSAAHTDLWRRGLRATALGATFALAGSGACIPNNHPLASSTGTIEIIFADNLPLFAADQLDDTGSPVLPRQEPYEKLVQLFMQDGQNPDQGAYVDVRLSIPGVLELVPVDDSCEYLSGSFRCTAREDGYATFVARSLSDWSGKLDIKIDGRPSDKKELVVNPAGITSPTNFVFIIGGVDSDIDVVQASYASLVCSTGAVPSTPEDKWPAGKIRSRKTIVRADPPASMPGIIENAPVVVESLHPEGALSLDPACVERTSRLRVLLDVIGQSPPFYMCFSDLGGNPMPFAAKSGGFEAKRNLKVAAEPRLLRIVTTSTFLPYDSAARKIADLSAYDAEFQRVSMPVEIFSTDYSVIEPENASLDTSTAAAVPLTVDSHAPGVARLQITPALHSSPACQTANITVQ